MSFLSQIGGNTLCEEGKGNRHFMCYWYFSGKIYQNLFKSFILFDLALSFLEIYPNKIIRNAYTSFVKGEKKLEII